MYLKMSALLRTHLHGTQSQGISTYDSVLLNVVLFLSSESQPVGLSNLAKMVESTIITILCFKYSAHLELRIAKRFLRALITHYL